MDTLQIHLFGNLKISISLVAANLLHLLQIRNQLEKLEAAKAAGLVYLSLLSLTGSSLALLSLI